MHVNTIYKSVNFDIPFLVLGEGGSDDAAGRFFHGLVIVGRDVVATGEVGTEKTPPTGAGTFAGNSILHRH